VTSARGRVVSDRLAGPADEIALVPTVRSLAATRSRAGGAGAERTGAAASGIEPDDLRTAVRVGPRQRTIVLCVDLSGSMGGPERAAAASGTVLGLLDRAYQQRERVALVGFRDKGATVLLSPTASVEVARNRLDDLTTGGATPLADGIVTGLAVAERASGPHNEVLLVLLSDGRATGSPEALDRALDAAGRVRRAGIASLVLDCETGRHRLGLAATVAEAMGAEHVHVDSLDPDHLARTIRSSP
jgi:magnesium chelatase subunit D